MPSNYHETSIRRIEAALPLHDDVPFIIDDSTLALTMGFKLRVLWWLILRPQTSYKAFKIPKASGKLREIFAPSGPMKAAANRIRALFLVPLVRKLGAHVTAYREGRGARDAARVHMFDCGVCGPHDGQHTCDYSVTVTPIGYTVSKTGDCAACATPRKHENCPRRGVKVHMDLRDFFPNTRAAWIRDYLMNSVGYNYGAANILASLMTVRMSRKMADGKTIFWHGVPQGSPTSGDICNLVADYRLDQPLLRVLEGSGWRYTRYADDLYFSHPENLPADGVTHLLREVQRVVCNSGWKLNYAKLRIQRAGSNQRLLGMTVNQKPNIPRDEYRRIRSAIHRCWYNGFDGEAAWHGKTSGAALASWLTGKLAWYSTINPGKTARLRSVLMAAKERHPKGTGDGTSTAA